MARRYHPRGKGWTRVVDYGDCVGWLRPNPDGPGVQAVLYGPASWIGRDDQKSRDMLVYEVTEASYPWFVIDEVFNKPSRFHRLLVEDWDNPFYEDGEPRPANRNQIVWSVRRMPASHHGHRRLNPRRRVWMGGTELPGPSSWRRGKRMPRKIRLALYGEH